MVGGSQKIRTSPPSGGCKGLSRAPRPARGGCKGLSRAPRPASGGCKGLSRAPRPASGDCEGLSRAPRPASGDCKGLSRAPSPRHADCCWLSRARIVKKARCGWLSCGFSEPRTVHGSVCRQDTEVWQIPVCLRVVEAMTNDEFVVDCEAQIVDVDLYFSTRRLVQ